ncbi:hypothetical protein [Merdibacter massiliensis]|uniref:hypothetical protein n=1 Tax=Merdibacter massiliensis TaxID=1871030 RepID=UPI001179BC09|nr:hypothetical protein [Merdibacter massiliensis]
MIRIKNESGNEYRYKENSFVLAPEDTSQFGSLEEGSLLPLLTYDGQYMPIMLSGSMIPYYFYKDVFGVSSCGNVTFEMMCQIYDYLAEKGYTGDTAITDYMLNYFNNLHNANYESLTVLFAEHPDWLNEKHWTDNGIWTMTEDDLLKYIEEYPWINQYVYVTPKGNKLDVQIKWPETALSTASYNGFYSELFSIVYGKENVDALDPVKGTTFSRAHAVGDYLPGTDLYEETDAYFENLTEDGFKDGDTIELWSGFGLDGPATGNSYQYYSFSFYNTIELEQVQPISVEPADITIYTGGNGYDGVISGVDGSTTESEGFPTPGFHLTLPEELQEKLGSIQDLSNLVTFKYDDGKGTTRAWNLELYGVPDHSNDKVGYVYKLVPALEGQDPVRMLLEDEQGNAIVSDDFNASVNEQYKQYEMSIYSGALDVGYITAEITVNGKTYTYPVEQSTSATLTVRANIDEVHAPIVNDESKIASGDFAGVSVENPTYFVNDNNVQVADISGVRLMVDELLDEDVLVDYLMNNDKVTLPEGDNLTFEQKYMDLVDTNNGDAYLTMGEGETTTVYWPVPEDYVEGNDVYIYHFSGVDRDYNTGDVEGNIDELITIIPTLETINGNQYFVFETSSFSPFVLAYANNEKQEPAQPSDPQKPTDIQKPTTSTETTDAAPDTSTSDNVVSWMILLGASSLLTVAFLLKRKMSN